MTDSPKATELFLPGRSSYIFELHGEFGQEIPTTLVRSKEDCPTVQSRHFGKLRPQAVESITRVMNYLHQVSAKPKKRKQPKPQPRTSSFSPQL